MEDSTGPAEAGPPKSAFDDIVERWWHDHFPGSPVAAVTQAWNHAFAAKEELKWRLANLDRPNSAKGVQ